MSAQSRRSRLELEDNGEVAVVNFRDKKILDPGIITKIGEDLFSLVDEYQQKKILLDFNNVEYLSSSAIGKFITLNKKCWGIGGKLILCNINEDIFEVFEVHRLDKLFNIQKDKETALHAF